MLVNTCFYKTYKYSPKLYPYSNIVLPNLCYVIAVTTARSTGNTYKTLGNIKSKKLWHFQEIG